jgi:hypothetical protein
MLHRTPHQAVQGMWRGPGLSLLPHLLWLGAKAREGINTRLMEGEVDAARAPRQGRAVVRSGRPNP